MVDARWPDIRLPDADTVRALVWLAVAVVSAVAMAIGVVYSVHASRQLVNELQSMQREADSLQVAWGQLLLEKSAWGSYAYVEATARTRLDMYVPTVKEIVVVTP